MNLDERIEDLLGVTGYDNPRKHNEIRNIIRDMLDYVKPEQKMVLLDYAYDEPQKYAEPDHTIELGRRQAIDEMETKIKELGLSPNTDWATRKEGK